MLRLNPESLKYFIIFTESKNFTEASKKLDISVSAIIQSINNLEKKLDFKLINRNKDNQTITNEGKIFLEKAKDFIEELSNIELFIKAKDFYREELKIGWNNFWGSYILPEMIEKTFQKYSNIYPKVYGFSLEEAQSLILNNTLDFAIVTGEINNEIKISINDEIKYLKGKKVNILDIYSKKDSNINATISSLLKIDNQEFHIETPNLSVLILLLQNLDIKSRIPSIIYEKISLKKNLNIKKNLSDDYLVPYLIWNKNMILTETKSYFISTFEELQ
ncbi:MAG: LysR family transcriptional regulator [Cyanobacteriota bacterium]